MPPFLDGLHHQRSMGYPLRTEALQFILDDVKLFTTSASRFDVFSKLIGYKPATVNSQAFYDRFEVPLLYDKWDGTIDVNTLSPGNVVLEVHLRFLHPRASRRNGVFEGNSKLLQAKCHERIHKITCTTTVFSDHMAVFYGHTTREGDETTVIDTASNDEELDDIFGQARSAVERTAPQVTSPSQDNHKDDMQAGHPRLPHPRIHATSLQAHRNCHPAPSPMVSSTIQPTVHHLPDANYSSPGSALRHQPVPPASARWQSSS
ncbi:hypothetical protein B0H13DRAFT_2371873 [Mycena leptocephala]|nr:hypothetical protein B0H13DRAFT_2371873 [Mycena leptocephala]